MAWKKGTFLEGVKWLLDTFRECPGAVRLALVWRSPDQYSIMDEWLLEHIKMEFEGNTLRVCLWLSRQEAAELLALFAKGV